MRDPAHQRRPLFVDAIEIPASLEVEGTTPYAERLHRDRAVGATLASSDPLLRARAWRRAPSTPEPDASVQRLAARLEHARRVIGLVVAIVGAVAGAGVASALFHYDGTWPVNVVTVLAVLVFLQLGLMVLTLLLMLPHVPGIAAVQELLGGLNPATVVAAIYRRVVRLDDGRAETLIWSAARGPAMARFARWQTLVWSQVGAIAFNVAALATAAALITFTDIAFGWSTTLRLDAAVAVRITDALAAPWRALWPDAVPSQTLVENSRFFRLSSAPPLQIEAQALTGWWPFVLAAVATYGLLPRCVLLLVAGARLRAATAHLLLDHPQVKALLDRMNSPAVALGADDVEEAVPCTGTLAAPAPVGTTAAAAAIIWSSAIALAAAQTWSRQHLQKEVSFIVEGGGGRSLGDDKAAIEAVAAKQPTVVLLLVRAWEAPLLDLQDFLEGLRAALGPACSIIVVPIGAGSAVASETQRATWARWVGRIADPALYMESGA